MSSLKNEEKETSLSGSVILGSVVALFGAFLGFVYLVSFEAEAYSSLAEHEKELSERESAYSLPGDAFYLKGSVGRTPEWQAKRKVLFEGNVQELMLNEQELNAWVSSRFRAPKNAPEGASGIVLLPDTPNLSLGEEGKVHLSMPVDFEAAGQDGEFVLSIVGSFSKSSPPAFQVESLQINAAPLPLAGIVGSKILPVVLGPFQGSEEFQAIAEAWSRVESASVQSGGLALRFR